MKRRLAKLISAIICAAVALSTVIIMRTDISAVSNPLLYYNDRTWPREDNLPIIEKYNLYFVPVTLFEQLRDVNVLINENFNTFMIEHGDKYLTFEVGTDFAVNQDKVRMFIMTYEHYDEYYVPVETVCDMLDLGYETLTSSITGETALRVTDGSQKYTFAECIFRKYPGFFLPETTTEERVTTDETTKPPVTETTTQREDEETTIPAPVLGERTIYLTIEDSPGDATEDILDVLKRYGYKATFFIIGDAARENPVLVSRIVGEGHALGLHTMSHDTSSLDSAEDILSDITAENELLYSLVKQKSHIWRAPEGSEDVAALDDKGELMLNQDGYLIWDYTVEPSGYDDIDAAAGEIIDGIWRQTTPVIRLCEHENTAEILENVLKFISEHADVCEVRTISPAYYEFNRAG